MEYVIGQTLNLKRTVNPGGTGVRSARAQKDTRTVTGLCSVFGNIDNGGDIVLPGAFKKAIDDFNAGRSRCRFLWNHDSKEPPVARIIEMKELTGSQLPTAYRSMVDVNGALQITRQYFTDAYSERVYQGVVSGAISEMSFAYNVLDYEYETVKGQKVRLLKNIELMDACDVNWGMNPVTMGTLPKHAMVLTTEKIQAMKLKHAESVDRARQIAELKYSAKQLGSTAYFDDVISKAEKLLARWK